MRLLFSNQTTLLAIVLLTVSACSDSGGSDGGGIGSDGNGHGNSNGHTSWEYSGSESAAVVTADNREDIATASRESTVELIMQSEGEDVPLLPSGARPQTSTSLAGDLTQELIKAGQLPTASTYDMEGPCGGTASMDYSADGESGSIVYNNYCASGGPEGNVIINGRIVYSMTETMFTYEYQNVTVSYGGNTQVLNMEMRCDTEGSYNCTYSSNFAGSDGRIYRNSDSQVSGNASSGYNVSARVYDPEHGYFYIQASNIILCDGGGIGTGNISVTDSTGSEVFAIDFTSCDSMVVTYNGNSEIYSQ